MSESEHAKELFFQALAAMDSSNFRDAELRLRDALGLVPGQASILTNLSIALMQQHKRAEAREYAEQAIAVNPKTIEALLVLADCDMHDDNSAAAMATYDRILELDPGIAEIHNNRGIVLERLGHYADAVESYNRALALSPDLGNVHANRGNALRRLGRYDEAFAAYDQALALTPDLAEAWLGRGNALCDVNRLEDALAAYDRTLATRYDLPHAWLGRGNALSKLKRYGEALTDYEKAIALQPDFAEAWLGCGNARRDLGRDDEALKAFDRALALVPSLAAACVGRGNVFHDRKNFTEALTAYDRALTLDPALANAWVGRGHALRYLKRAPESIAAYRHALTLGGDAESIKFYLAALGAEPLPVASPRDFVANLFDGYAEKFDHDLIENLKYRTPLLVADAIKRYVSSRGGLDIVDMGCGTGLMGEHIRSIARTLTGVDLSANMLEKARQRQIYDHLLCCDLTEFLQTQGKIFDLAVAADVFVYLGDLSPIFLAVRRALIQGGVFCFSVEAEDDGDFTLRSTLRYAHSMGYLRRLAEQHQFIVEMIDPQVIRRDAGANINGYLAVMRNS
jgi:predicted TPR repeat methyltransferase